MSSETQCLKQHERLSQPNKAACRTGSANNLSLLESEAGGLRVQAPWAA